MIRVSVADDHPLMREGIKKVLASEIDINVVAEVSNGDEIISELSKNRSDILIMDIAMPGRSWLDSIKDIKSYYPYLSVLVLSIYAEEKYAIRALKAGAKGYLCKSCIAEKLALAIRRIVVEKRKFITPAVAEQLAIQIDQADRAQHENLSDREFEIMCLIAAGKNAHEIASELSLSFHTVHTYRSRIKEKMELTSNVEIARYAIQNRLVK